MIGTMTVVGIRHLTHNQVVAGSSPAGPRGLHRLPYPRLWWLKKDYDHAASYGYSLECEAKDVRVLEPRGG